MCAIRFPQRFGLRFDLPEGFPSNVCLVYSRKLANKNSRTWLGTELGQTLGPVSWINEVDYNSSLAEYDSNQVLSALSINLSNKLALYAIKTFATRSSSRTR